MPFSRKREGTCYGGAPKVGDTAVLFDFERSYLGTLRVKSVEPRDTDLLTATCQSSSTFEFHYEFVSHAAQPTNSQVPLAIAVFGVEIDPLRAQLITDAKKLPLPGMAGTTKPWMGLDKDGDEQIDIVVTALECTDIAPMPANLGTKTAEAYCMDYWFVREGSFTHVRRDYMYTC